MLSVLKSIHFLDSYCKKAAFSLDLSSPESYLFFLTSWMTDVVFLFSICVLFIKERSLLFCYYLVIRTFSTQCQNYLVTENFDKRTGNTISTDTTFLNYSGSPFRCKRLHSFKIEIYVPAGFSKNLFCNEMILDQRRSLDHPLLFLKMFLK